MHGTIKKKSYLSARVSGWFLNLRAPRESNLKEEGRESAEEGGALTTRSSSLGLYIVLTKSITHPPPFCCPGLAAASPAADASSSAASSREEAVDEAGVIDAAFLQPLFSHMVCPSSTTYWTC